MTASANYVGQLLFQAGWLPVATPINVTPTGDLLRSVQQAWATCESASLRTGDRSDTTRLRNWLQQQMAAGAQLTWLGHEAGPATRWLGERLLWWPHGRFTGSRIGIASSRLGRRLDAQLDWFTVFRAACLKMNRGRDVVWTASATTPDRYVRRAAELFGFRVVSVICPAAEEPLLAWLQRIRDMKVWPSEAVRPAYLSPPLSRPSRDVTAPWSAEHPPMRDQAVVSLAERLFVFHVRRRGRLERLLRARLEDSTWPTASVYVALGHGLVERDIAEELLDRGAVGWLVLDTLQHAAKASHRRSTLGRAAVIELPATDDWCWLTHCTRAQANGWPDQQAAEYLDELLLNRDVRDRSAFAAIQRIIATQRLVATCRMIRGDTKVVCFTAVPLRELPGLRTFRPHVTRWDFEPYGICIRQDWLTEHGGAPVRYGDDTLWESLPAAERPLFQIRRSRSRRSGSVTDWSVEREWRHRGDVDLRKLPSEAGLIFAPTYDEAERLAFISRWPVTVLNACRD